MFLNAAYPRHDVNEPRLVSNKPTLSIMADKNPDWKREEDDEGEQEIDETVSTTMLRCTKTKLTGDVELQSTEGCHYPSH